MSKFMGDATVDVEKFKAAVMAALAEAEMAAPSSSDGMEAGYKIMSAFEILPKRQLFASVFEANDSDTCYTLAMAVFDCYEAAYGKENVIPRAVAVSRSPAVTL